MTSSSALRPLQDKASSKASRTINPLLLYQGYPPPPPPPQPTPQAVQGQPLPAERCPRVPRERPLQAKPSSKESRTTNPLPLYQGHPPPRPANGSITRIQGQACQSRELPAVTRKNFAANEDQCPAPLQNSNSLILIQIQQAGHYNLISIGHVILMAFC